MVSEMGLFYALLPFVLCQKMRSFKKNPFLNILKSTGWTIFLVLWQQMTDSFLLAFNCIKNFSNINVSVSVKVFTFLFHCPKHQGNILQSPTKTAL